MSNCVTLIARVLARCLRENGQTAQRMEKNKRLLLNVCIAAFNTSITALIFFAAGKTKDHAKNAH